MNQTIELSMGKQELKSAHGYEDAASCFRSIAPVFYRMKAAHFLMDLSVRCAEDADLMALADESKPGQPYQLMFFGAVHSILLANPADPFAPFFGVGPRPPVADDATFAALKDFCRRRRDEIVAILKWRTVQFTQPSRASLMIPLLGHILAKGAKEPLSLVEVGCSAGLLTVFDSYYFDFGPFGRLGDPANLHISVPAVHGDTPPIPDHMPKISERFGIDLNPVDLSDPAERFWIEGLVPPELTEERSELRAALDVRARIPLQTIKGDALKVLPELLPKLNDTICLAHTFCLYQWPTALQNQLHEILLEASCGRTIYRVGADYMAENPARPHRIIDPTDMPGVDMFAVTYADGKANWEYLGLTNGVRHITWAA